MSDLGNGDVRSSRDKPFGIVGPSVNGGGLVAAAAVDRAKSVAVASSDDSR